jgi:AbiU2
MIDLQRTDPKQILTASWHEEYHSQKQTIGLELVKLNACILVLEKVNSFPFHIFAPYRGKSHFWELTSVCLFESALLAIWKVGIDPRSDGLTLRQFKNGIRRYLQDEQVQLQLVDALDAGDFEARLSGLEGKVRDLRHKIVAHWNRSWLNADFEFRTKRAVDVTHLKSTAEVLDELFHVLCFGSDFATLPIDYFLDKHNPGRGTDIDELLDDIARKSPALRRPEENPAAWKELKTKLSAEDIKSFNSYRTRLELKPA